MNNRTYEFNYDGTVTSAGTVTNTKTYEFDYEETVTSAGTVAGRIVSYDIVFSDPVPTDNASLITSGTLSDARLSSNVPLKNTVNIFTQNQTINGDVYTIDFRVPMAANPVVKNIRATGVTRSLDYSFSGYGSLGTY